MYKNCKLILTNYYYKSITNTLALQINKKHVRTLLVITNECVGVLRNFPNFTIGILRKLYNILPRSALLTLYKSFMIPHLDYGNIIYGQAYKASFHQKLELLQYNACLVKGKTL